ncbi:MAG: universal stress protein [Chromatiales bacterium]
MKRERLLVLLQSAEPYSQPEPALACAVFLARETNATLELFLSDQSPSRLSIGQAGLRGSSACADLRGTQVTLEAIGNLLVNEERLTVATDVVSSRDPIEALMEKVRQMRPDMVVKTTRHDSTLTRALYNSTDWHLIRSCPCPLMLVKGHEVWESRRVIACVDPAHIHSDAETLDDAIMEAAQMLAYRLRAELHVFHSIAMLSEPVFRLLHPQSSYVDYERTTADEHKDLVEDLIRRFGIGDSRVHYAVGWPTETLPAFASAIQASLVVMGAVAKGTLELLFMGNTAEKVLDDLNCAVLVVKSTPVAETVRETEFMVC